MPPEMPLALHVAFVIGGLRRQTSTLKPFNPILGETYQGQYNSGLQVLAEQISHHPPVSSWQVEDAEGRVSINSTLQTLSEDVQSGTSIQAAQNAILARQCASVTALQVQ